MADYWKSTGKKYCDFCKCWTADNKASIQFHENGKNHQNNVKKRLAEIKRNSMEKRKSDEASKKMFEKMEKAALAAVQKDVNNADVTVGKSDMKNIVKANADPGSSSSDNSTYPWQAMTAPQGITYYYNSLTGESSWQMPEVFKNLEEKNKKKKEDDEYQKSLKNLPGNRKKCWIRKLEYLQNAFKMHSQNQVHAKFRTNKDPYRAKPKEEEGPVEVRNVHPLLGGWSTVKTYELPDELSTSTETQSTEDDNNLATSTTAEDTAEPTKTDGDDQPAEERETGKKFKEKVIKTNIATTSDEPVSFKKRKTVSRNVRRRNDDD